MGEPAANTAASPRSRLRRAIRVAALPAIMAFGAFLRWLRLWRNPVISRDGLFYLNDYSHWFSDDISRKNSPALGRLLELGDNLGMAPEKFVILLNLICGIALIGAVYGIVKALWGRRIPALAARRFPTACRAGMRRLPHGTDTSTGSR